MEVNGNSFLYEHDVHPLNNLYNKNSMKITYNGVKIIAAVEKRAQFSDSDYVLVHLTQSTEIIEKASVKAKIEEVKIQFNNMETNTVEPEIETYLKPTYMEKYNAGLLSNGQYLKIKTGTSVIHYRCVEGTIQSAVLVYDDAIEERDAKKFKD